MTEVPIPPFVPAEVVEVLHEGRPRSRPVHEREPSAYEQITREKVESLERAYNRVETRLNAILGGITVSVVLQVLANFFHTVGVK